MTKSVYIYGIGSNNKPYALEFKSRREAIRFFKNCDESFRSGTNFKDCRSLESVLERFPDDRLKIINKKEYYRIFGEI